jgi:hypothetical protein
MDISFALIVAIAKIAQRAYPSRAELAIGRRLRPSAQRTHRRGTQAVLLGLRYRAVRAEVLNPQQPSLALFAYKHIAKLRRLRGLGRRSRAEPRYNWVGSRILPWCRLRRGTPELVQTLRAEHRKRRLGRAAGTAPWRHRWIARGSACAGSSTL